MLGKIATLRRKAEFSAVYERGSSLPCARAVLIHLRTDDVGFKYAVVASRKVGGAVRRNRAKRLLREALRHTLDGRPLPEGLRIVLIARRATADASGAEVLDAVTRLYIQAGLSTPDQRLEQ